MYHACFVEGRTISAVLPVTEREASMFATLNLQWGIPGLNHSFRSGSGGHLGSNVGDQEVSDGPLSGGSSSSGDRSHLGWGHPGDCHVGGISSKIS